MNIESSQLLQTMNIDEVSFSSQLNLCFASTFIYYRALHLDIQKCLLPLHLFSFIAVKSGTLVCVRKSITIS